MSETSAASQRAADGLLINGSVNNGASSPFAQLQAFGNNRRGVRSLYNGSVGFNNLNLSALDARNYSLTGQNTIKPSVTQIQGLAAFGGPLKIPGLLERNGPNFTVNYQWLHNSTGQTQTGLVPTAAQRMGDLPGMTIPLTADQPTGSGAVELLSPAELPRKHALQLSDCDGRRHAPGQRAGANEQAGQEESILGRDGAAKQSYEQYEPVQFSGYQQALGQNLQLGWRHSFTPRTYINFGYQFSRFSSTSIPFFANHQNVSGQAGITGNNQDPLNWGPPSLSFTSGISGLSDSQYSAIHNQTDGFSFDGLWNRGRHNLTYGADYRRQQLNSFSQQNPRGQFQFTGQAEGSDFAGFLLGVPDAASIAFGNADKYFRYSELRLLGPGRLAHEVVVHAECGPALGLHLPDLRAVWPPGKSGRRSRIHRSCAGRRLQPHRSAHGAELSRFPDPSE